MLCRGSNRRSRYSCGTGSAIASAGASTHASKAHPQRPSSRRAPCFFVRRLCRRDKHLVFSFAGSVIATNTIIFRFRPPSSRQALPLHKDDLRNDSGYLWIQRSSPGHALSTSRSRGTRHRVLQARSSTIPPVEGDLDKLSGQRTTAQPICKSGSPSRSEIEQSQQDELHLGRWRRQPRTIDSSCGASRHFERWISLI